MARARVAPGTYGAAKTKRQNREFIRTLRSTFGPVPYIAKSIPAASLVAGGLGVRRAAIYDRARRPILRNRAYPVPTFQVPKPAWVGRANQRIKYGFAVDKPGLGFRFAEFLRNRSGFAPGPMARLQASIRAQINQAWPGVLGLPVTAYPPTGAYGAALTTTWDCGAMNFVPIEASPICNFRIVITTMPVPSLNGISPLHGYWNDNTYYLTTTQLYPLNTRRYVVPAAWRPQNNRAMKPRVAALAWADPGSIPPNVWVHPRRALAGAIYDVTNDLPHGSAASYGAGRAVAEPTPPTRGRGPVRVVPNLPDVPPGSGGVRERKHPGIGRALQSLGVFSEARDVVEAVWKGLPAQYRRGTRNRETHRQLVEIWRHYDKLKWEHVAWHVVYNHYEDKVYGGVFGRAGKAARQFGGRGLVEYNSGYYLDQYKGN